ncbi:2'-5' RNA ligase family protein [Cumulibacter soli]|uniref:2'-5' RNA ligase family protein n=1 Tax=Cumulibacter soli TaxID=2546344 RepID=UPI001068491C|nr:2'-5' RNA ligase family protein [Cumulibacter soli]
MTSLVGLDEAQVVTLGLSIPIPAPYDEQLRAVRRRAGDALADLVAPHITLVPPTPVRRQDVETLLSRVRERCAQHRAFLVRLRGTGSFRPVSDVVFVAVADGIAGCEQLAADLLDMEGLRITRSFPYHPHVTIAQDVDEQALDAAFERLENFRADLRVDAVSVHRQESDGSWIPIAAYPLREETPSGS